MTEEEAKNIFKTIIALYPAFNSKGNDQVKTDVAKAWIWKLKKGDYKKTMQSLDRYSNNSPFPPSVADILTYEQNNIRNVDYSKDIEKVNEEKYDPEKSKLREEKLKKLYAMLGGVMNE